MFGRIVDKFETPSPRETNRPLDLGHVNEVAYAQEDDSSPNE
jgi:hypothetical protein